LLGAGKVVLKLEAAKVHAKGCRKVEPR